MSLSVHEAVLELVSDFLGKALLTGFMTSEEQGYVRNANASVRLARSWFDPNRNRKKLQAWANYPDAVILFGDTKSPPLPSVVFGVILCRVRQTWSVTLSSGLGNLVEKSDLLFL